jgi:hypothetical protein
MSAAGELQNHSGENRAIDTARIRVHRHYRRGLPPSNQTISLVSVETLLPAFRKVCATLDWIQSKFSDTHLLHVMLLARDIMAMDTRLLRRLVIFAFNKPLLRSR